MVMVVIIISVMVMIVSATDIVVRIMATRRIVGRNERLKKYVDQKEDQRSAENSVLPDENKRLQKFHGDSPFSDCCQFWRARK
jgi:hypothetical protein